MEVQDMARESASWIYSETQKYSAEARSRPFLLDSRAPESASGKELTGVTIYTDEDSEEALENTPIM
jgi:hypothetical protein